MYLNHVEVLCNESGSDKKDWGIYVHNNEISNIHLLKHSDEKKKISFIRWHMLITAFKNEEDLIAWVEC